MNKIQAWFAGQLIRVAVSCDAQVRVYHTKILDEVAFDSKTPLGLLLVTVDKHVERLGREQRRHKRETTEITLVTVGLSALSSVLLGLNFPPNAPAQEYFNPLNLKNCALVFTALVAVVNAYEALFKPHRLWVREGRTYGLLNDLLLKLAMCAARTDGGKTATTEEVEAFRQELEKMMREDLDSWVRQHGEDLLTGRTRGDQPGDGQGKNPPPAKPGK